MRDPLLIVEGLSKDFTLHQQGGVQLPVLRGVSLTVRAGECIALTGPSGAGKSTPVQALSDNDLSGGEQQRVNLARGFALPYTVMLVDEPTASLVRPIPKSRSR
jgi:alpha-D-ribose 1-methylphosphonate 5-triphosphate synthase subunit PhnL